MIAITSNVIKVTKHFGFRRIAGLLHILQFDAQRLKMNSLSSIFCPLTSLILETDISYKTLSNAIQILPLQIIYERL